MAQLTQPDLASWHGDIPSLVSEIGEENLFETLNRSLYRLVPFELSCIFSYTPHARPTLIYDGLKNVAPKIVMFRYLNGTYLLDAVYEACLRNIQPGLYRLSELAPDNFFGSEYYNSPEFHPCISMETGSLSEEIVFITQVHDSYLAYSLLRQKHQAPFSHHEFSLLQQTTRTVLALLTAQHRMSKSEGSPEPSREKGDNHISSALNTFAHDSLTSRERTIAAMILRGHSSASIAKNLYISEGTVKNHRKNIYRKLNINKQSQLFALFIQYIFDDQYIAE